LVDCHRTLDRATAFSDLNLQKSKPSKLFFRTLTFGQPTSDK
jgi:hypothetical protein